MTVYAAVCLLMAMLTGLSMVFLGVRFHRSSVCLARMHASFAVAGVAILGWVIYQGPMDKQNNLAALLLVIALIGGGMLFAMREPARPPALSMVVIHALMAVAGVTVLLIGLLT